MPDTPPKGLTHASRFTFFARLLLLGTLVCVLTPFSHGQWTTQTVILQPGWNAIFLEVQPEPRDCASAFAAVPVESVQGWNRRFSSVQYIDNPAEVTPKQPDWLSYFPPGHALASQTDLFSLEGGKPYLIKIAGNSTITWTILGVPSLRKTDWLSDSFNLVGFTVNTANPPTFQSFFQGSAAHVGQPIYRLNSTGYWVPASPTAPMQSGQAFWIYTRGQSQFSGPITVTVEQGRSLDYGRALVEQPLTIKNASTVSNALTIRKLASLNPPNGSYPALAGEVPLAYWHMNPASNQFGWVPLTGPLTKTLAPGGEWSVRLEVRRATMGPYAGPVTSAGAVYQGILEVVDNAGSRSLVPVTAKGIESRAGLWLGHAVLTNVSHPAGMVSSSLFTPRDFVNLSNLVYGLTNHIYFTNESQLLRSFLWSNFTYASQQSLVTNSNAQQLKSMLAEEFNTIIRAYSIGTNVNSSIYDASRFSGLTLSAATSNQLSAVSTNSSPENLLRLNRLLLQDAFTADNFAPSEFVGPNTPVPTGSAFQFRLIIHVPSNGTPTLLSRVQVMWKPGSYTTTPDGWWRVAQPGRYAWVTDERLVHRFTGAVLQDGIPVPRRFSSAAFSTNLTLTTINGAFGYAGNILTTALVLDYDDRLNPFKHRYHPDHDNIREGTENERIAEAFTVTRQITLEFTEEDPERLTLAGWGDTHVGGIYREAITGLHKNTLHAQGTFRLHQISDVGILNDGSSD